MIAANANTVLRAMDYNLTYRLVAYAAANAVLIIDPYAKPAGADGRVVP